MTPDEEIAEFFEERAAIFEFEGKMTREAAERMALGSTETHRHACEVASVVRMYQNEGKNAVTSFLQEVEKRRGKDAAQKIRTDALAKLAEMGGGR